MAKKFYVTTAIAYPNSIPHLGHCLEIIQCDVVARFHRLLEEDVHFQTGTDEHGLKNWQTAKKEGKDIIEFLDAHVAVFKDLYKRLSISYDYFIRTSNKKAHYPGVIKLWKALAKSGDLYKKNYSGMYCTGCEAFKTEKELEDKKCPNHPTRDIEIVKEENYFFRLSNYSKEITEKIESDEYKIIPEIKKNEILSFLKEAKDISFSRPKTTLPWGITVPDDDTQVMYVWCDALSNYITGAGYGADEARFKQIWPADVHIIGKDILRFHAAFWPAMLLSAKIALPKKLFVHGFILSKGTKMGKSTGNVIEPFEQINRYGVDQFRFYLMGTMPINGDGEYSEDILKKKINTELVGNVANFCYRVLSFTNKNFGSKISQIDNNQVIQESIGRYDEVRRSYTEFDFKKAIDEIMSISALGNKYLQDNEPWKLIKEDKDEASKVLGLCVNLAKNLSILIQPIIPTFSEQIQKQLNLKELKWKDINFDLKNHKINQAEILIKKIEDVMDQKVFPLNLRVAEIIEVKDHPNADKLYVLQIKLGKEKKQLVAGIKRWYSKEDLAGKKIVIVSNLKHAKLRGQKSEGMLLTGEFGDKVVLFDSSLDSGEQVKLKSYVINDKQIDFKEFEKVRLEIKNKKIFYKETELEGISVDIKDSAQVR